VNQLACGSLFHRNNFDDAMTQTVVNLANFHWFSVVWTLIYHDLRHHMVKMLWTHEAQPSESATNFDHVMT
jgi:hypothetical protein